MKYLKNIDFAGQSIILLSTLGFSLISVMGTGELEAMAYFGLIGQFFIGCWQMLSSSVLLLLKAEHHKSRSLHFYLALCCLFLLALVVSIQKSIDPVFGQSILIITGVVIPWCLALYYYSITWRWMFPTKSTGRFLPHINF